MKTLLLPLLILCTLSVPAMAQGGFARAEEFGAPRLNITPPQYLTPSALRTWRPAGEPPLQAELLRIEGEWGNSAQAVLSTPMGRLVPVPLRALSDADIEAAEQWMQQNGFITIRTYKHGTHRIKPISVIPLTYLSFGRYRVRFCKPDGSIHCWVTNNGEVYPVELRNGNLYYMPREYSKQLTEVEKQQKARAGVPLPVAENVMEAMAYSAMHGVCITIVRLGTRGSMADVVFRHYLKTHPHAGYHWSMRHVFLLVYTDEYGRIPPETLRELTTLKTLHSNFKSIAPELSIEESQSVTLFQQFHCMAPNELRGESIRPANYDVANFGGSWSYKPDEFLRLPATEVSFSVQ